MISSVINIILNNLIKLNFKHCGENSKKLNKKKLKL
jgi:hypothetical protein